MNTNKARNITIISLLLLNAALFACNLLFSDLNRYRITTEAANNITEVLARNNITFAARDGFLRDFKPMGRLDTQTYVYDIDFLLRSFFKTPDTAELTQEDNRRIYRNDTESLSVNLVTGFVVYRDRSEGAGMPDYADASALADALITKLGIFYKDFELDAPPYETEEGLVFEYRQRYKGYTINSNYVIIIIDDAGIIRAEFMCAQPIGLSREAKDITPPDEILITCMHEIKNIYGERGAVIEQMDLVYHQSETAAALISSYTQNGANSAYAEPYYRIKLAESPEPILVNAYTNSALSYGF